jgi:hypothetical protein
VRAREAAPHLLRVGGRVRGRVGVRVRVRVGARGRGRGRGRSGAAPEQAMRSEASMAAPFRQWRCSALPLWCGKRT